MRLDKFLKISLIFKTRSSAEKSIEDNEILLNGKIAKPSSNIKEGDILTIKFPFKTVTYKILKIEEKNISKSEAKKMYEILKEEKNEL
ncbi:MAG TPA: RNA-binding S4 domain-containing protein [Spirochaetota bacterium]|nr:RNA-binding S4 domain-containing protein [Spirochaetota bacterium]HOL57441.1 RNA-binding S4 domain-containing protein [Spirochaetota bacterium]HPP05292.1 RNA-binding S4 domain-containing protein [Spirochaetota bacterium]